MQVLVCGGAGYIGSHMVRLLKEHGDRVVVLDNLSTGHRGAVDDDIEFVQADLLDPGSLERAFSLAHFDAVVHFCARSLVAESVAEPYAYYENNVVGTLNLLRAMRTAGVGRIVFSSTAAIFGVPESERIDEAHPTRPINPYGASKLMVERILTDAATAYGLRSVALRYFNAAGADPSGAIGESHDPESHLIPNILRSVLGKGPTLKVFGDDYPTRDGTCIRDYVHVSDLASAHLSALAYLSREEGAHAFNLGNGAGFTVLEVISAARRITGAEIPFELAPRRAGDPAVLVASSEKAVRQLDWVPRYSSMDDIISTAWNWHVNARY